MFKIMIVEDEQIERETLVKIIQKEGSAFCHEVVVAKNGNEALALFEKEQPHIVISDINIPGINGLEVIRRIKEKAKDTEFLVVSSYNYFEYAQEAIRLGVEDFILKPYTIKNLMEALEKIVQHLSEKNREERNRSELLEKIEKITPVVENECLYGIISNENELVLKKSLHLLSPMICSGFCFVMKAEAYDETYAQEVREGFKKLGLRCINDLFHGLQIYFVMGDRAIDKEQLSELESYMDVIQKDGYQYGIGPIVNDIADFHQSFRNAKKRLQQEEDIYIQLTNFLKANEEDRMEVKRYVKRFLTIFAKLDEEGLRNTLNQLSLQLILEDRDQIIKDVACLFQHLWEEAEQAYPQVTFDKKIEPLKITRNIHQEVPLYLHMQMHKLYDPISEERFRNTNLLVKQAVKYIDGNYRRQITLSDMADALHISPYYISKLLSSSMNKTFTELVSERRVEASKELLKTNKRIKEIAYEVGFQGQNYFTKVFKNYTGVTPKVYKNTFETKEYQEESQGIAKNS